MSTGVSSIYSHGPSPEPTGEVAEQRNHAARKALWHKCGWVTLVPDDITDDWVRQAVINEAVAAFGERQDGQGKESGHQSEEA